MNIVVPVKQTPDTGLPLTLSKSSIEESRVKWVMNPYDEFALEEAMKLKPLLGGKVFALSLGPSRVKETLQSALALGADEALHIETQGHVSDPLACARTLAEHIKTLPSVSLVFCGKLSVDTNDFAVPQMTAQMLNFPFVTNISSLKFEDGVFLLNRECGGGVEEVLQASPPLVLSADKGLNQPRYPSLPGIMKAKNKPLKSAPGEPIQKQLKHPILTPPPERPAPEMISGTPEEQIKTLLHRLKEREKLL